MPGPGDRIGGYVIDAVIGRGAMGAVYRAHQASLDRPVALKLIAAERMADAEAVASILAEARTAARIHHPHLVAIHDIIDLPEQRLAGYAMELVQGSPSTALVHASGRFDVRLALRLAAQVAGALGAAHQVGLVHRDVQPANVLVAPSYDGPTAKLLDLGLARERVRTGGTQSGIRQLVLIGTPGFIAPEQACNPERATPASDVYALAAVLVWWLTGRTAHGGETLIDHVVRSATSVPEIDPAVPDGLAELLEACLDPDPALRPGDGAALALRLGELADHDGEAMRRPPIRPRLRPRRR